MAVYLYNGPEFLETYFAAFKLRSQPINVNYRYLDDELAYLLENSDAQALVFHSSLAERVAAIDTTALSLLAQVPDTDAPLARRRSVVRRAPRRACRPNRPRRARPPPAVHRRHHWVPKGVIYEVGGLIRELVALGAPFLGATTPSTRPTSPPSRPTPAWPAPGSSPSSCRR